MKIAVTSQNFRTITQHAGKTRRFLVFEADPTTGQARELARLDLPKEMSMHEFRGDDHPIFEMDVLITASSGQGFIQRMAKVGVKVLVTSEEIPLDAAQSVFDGKALAAPEPHDHLQHQTPVMPKI
jgi:predicted Fe-Mo cluster-binding NifX family protein